MAPPPHTQVFEDAITITPLSSHTYSANLRQEWCIGAVPHGGYTTSLFGRLAKTHFAHTHPTLSTTSPTPISIQLSFLRRTDVGPALLTVQDMKLGARTNTIHVALSQPSKKNGNGAKNGEEEIKVTGYITLSPPSAETGVNGRTSWTPHPPPPPGSSGPVSLRTLASTGRDGQWIRTHAPFLKFRRATANIEMYGPDPASFSPEASAERRGVVDQWARFRPLGPDGKPLEGRWTDDTIGYLIDMFPMMLDQVDTISSEDSDGTQKGKSVRGTFWYPTVTLNVDYKKRLPAEGVEWLYSRIHTKVLKDGRLDIDVVVLDESGDIIALATQVGLVISASRNTAGRELNTAKTEQNRKAKL